MTDSHPYLLHLEDHYNTDDAEVRDEHALRDFVKHDVHARTEILQQYDRAYGDDTDLRRKAQLLHFGRKLRSAHHALRAAGK